MIKKLFAILLISSISFFAGSYYTMNNSPSKLLDWNKESIFQDGVELISVLPQNLEKVYDELKIILSNTLGFGNDKLENAPNQEKDGIKGDKLENQNNYTNLLSAPTEKLQKVNLDYYFEENNLSILQGTVSEE
ncbi:hypothetical protein MHH85_16740 [Viridibacillus sp. FSL E2-0187]|uniref:hypothetical protein n=1 Tax=Viridibacillus sp. FSL E2-0187 TaxID=2921362 RepID=UPI0030FA325E